LEPSNQGILAENPNPEPVKENIEKPQIEQDKQEVQIAPDNKGVTQDNGF